MKSVAKVLTTVLLAVLLCGAVQSVIAEEFSTVEISVRVEPGPEYTHTKWFVIIPMKLTPQMAVWIETGEGRFVRTIYLTKKAAEGTWRGGGDISRPEALPVYFHRSGLYDGSSRAGGADVVSSATPKEGDRDSQSWSCRLDLETGEYRIMAEVNSSFDYNERYPKQKDNVNGQPSLIYSAVFASGEQGGDTATRFTLAPIGHGDPYGRNGNVVPELEGFTSAMEMVENIYATVK